MGKKKHLPDPFNYLAPKWPQTKREPWKCFEFLGVNVSWTLVSNDAHNTFCQHSLTKATDHRFLWERAGTVTTFILTMVLQVLSPQSLAYLTVSDSVLTGSGLQTGKDVVTFLLRQLLLTWFLILDFIWGNKLNSPFFDCSCVFAVALTNILAGCWCTAFSWVLHREGDR